MRRVMPLMKARSLMDMSDKTVSRAPIVDGLRRVRRQASEVRRPSCTEPPR